MLSVFLFTVNSLKLTIPVVTLFGTAPTFFSLWVILKTVTSIFCSKQTYRKYDDHFYSIYQRSVLFFFQNWPNIKVKYNSN